MGLSSHRSLWQTQDAWNPLCSVVFRSPPASRWAAAGGVHPLCFAHGIQWFSWVLNSIFQMRSLGVILYVFPCHHLTLTSFNLALNYWGPIICPQIKTQHKRNRIQPSPKFLSDLSSSPSLSCHCLPSSAQHGYLTNTPAGLAAPCSSLLPARLVILRIQLGHCFAEGPPTAPYYNPHPPLAQQAQHPEHPHRTGLPGHPGKRVTAAMLGFVCIFLSAVLSD